MARIPVPQSVKPFQLTGGVASMRTPSHMVSASSQLRSTGFRVAPRRIDYPVEKPLIDKVGNVVQGEALQQLNNTIFKSAMQIADTISTREAKERAIVYQEKVNDLLHGDNGYLKLEGKVAYDAKDVTLQKIKQIKNELLSNSAPDVKAKMFNALHNQEQKYQTLVASHASREFKIWGEEVKQLEYQAVINDLATTVYDSSLTVDKLTQAVDSQFPREIDGTFSVKNKTERIAFINQAIAETLKLAYSKNITDPEVASNLASQLTSAKYGMGEDFYVDYNAINDIIAKGENDARRLRIQKRQDRLQLEQDQRDIAIKDISSSLKTGNEADALRKLDLYIRSDIVSALDKKHYERLIKGEKINEADKNIYKGDYTEILRKLNTAENTKDLDKIRDLITSPDINLHPNAIQSLFRTAFTRENQILGAARGAGLAFIKGKLDIAGKIIGPDEREIYGDMLAQTQAEYEPLIRSWVMDKNMSASDVIDKLQKDVFNVEGINTFSPLGLGDATIEEIHGIINSLVESKNEMSLDDYNQELKQLQWQLHMRENLTKLRPDIDKLKIDEIQPVPYLEKIKKKWTMPELFGMPEGTSPSAIRNPFFNNEKPIIEEDLIGDSLSSVRGKIDNKFKNKLSKSQKDELAFQITNMPYKKEFKSAYGILQKTKQNTTKVNSVKKEINRLLQTQDNYTQDEIINNLNILLNQLN